MPETGDREQQEWRTYQQAAAWLHVHQRTLRRLVEAGKLPFHRVGRRVLFRQGDLDAFPRRTRQKKRKTRKKKINNPSSKGKPPK